MKFRDLPAAQIGRLGEQLSVALLRRLGAGVVASFKFSGENDNEAPAIEFHDKRIVIPDADVSMRGRRFWLELKTYKEPQWNRAHRCMVHGVPIRLVEEYEQSERETATPVFLGVLEVSSGSLLVSNTPISQIARYACQCGCNGDSSLCGYREQWGNSYPQWYFRRDAFTEWHKLQGAELARLQAEHEKVSHAIRRHGSNRERAVRGPLSATTLIGDGVPRTAGWDHACLPCDSTWIGTKPHRCTSAVSWRRDYWIRRFAWAMPKATRDEIAALIDKPIARAELVKMLGAQWGATHDSAPIGTSFPVEHV